MSDEPRHWGCSGFCFKEADRCVEIAALNPHPIHKQTFRRLAAHWLGFARTCRGQSRTWFSWCEPKNGEASPRPWSPFVAHFISSYLKTDSDPMEVAKAYMAGKTREG